MFLLIQVGSSVNPVIDDPRDIECILIHDDNDLNEKNKALERLDRNIGFWEYNIEDYFKFPNPGFSMDKLPYNYQLIYWKIMAGDIDNFPQFKDFIEKFKVLSETNISKYKEYYKPKLNMWLKKKKCKLLYHLFQMMYIYKNQSYFDFTEEQKRIINLAHDRKELPEEAIIELCNFYNN